LLALDKAIMSDSSCLLLCHEVTTLKLPDIQQIVITISISNSNILTVSSLDYSIIIMLIRNLLVSSFIIYTGLLS